MFTVRLDQSQPKLAEAGTPYGEENASPNASVTPALIEVLVDIPTGQLRNSGLEKEQLFTYQIPGHLEVKPGDILSVPFGSQQVGAIAIRYTTELPSGLTFNQLKAVDDIVCRGLFSPTYGQLLEKIATYYQTPLTQVIRTALPAGLLRKSQRRVRLISENIPSSGETFLNPPARKILTLLQNSATQDLSWREIKKQVGGDYWARRGKQDLIARKWIEIYLDTPKRPRAKLRNAVVLVGDLNRISDLTKRQQEILHRLKGEGGEMWLNEFLQLCKTTTQTLKRLAEKGYVLLEAREVLRFSQGIDQTPDQPKSLTPDQQNALNTINSLSGFAQVLLHGVTGSGKTEVYLQAIAPIIAQGKSALVLVPEIGLTPQLTDRFRARFGDQVFVYHSGLSEGERYDTWRNLRTVESQIIIGTRSAIFLPLSKLGLIILDEEHDSSFKQNDRAPCYHARQVAEWRAELQKCPLILGSATPSLESWVTARKSEKYYLSLPQRVQSRPLPPIEVVDMRQELRQGNRTIFSFSLQDALQQLQAENKQGILFIHRRGHSTFASCRSCGYVMECPNCDVSLSYHHTDENAIKLLRCHYCNYSQLYPKTCPECGSPYFKHFGSGTQRVTQELTRLFPELRLIRFDSDTTQTKDAHRILLTRFANKEADLLIGTQMLTKGLDLAEVNLVGVVSADGLLHFSDYRASERTFQTLLQVAGRAGRGDDPGRVIIQTYTPENSVIKAVQNYQYEAFVEAELQQRQELNNPPYSQLILLRLSSLDAAEVEQTASQLAERLTAGMPEFEMLGPAPAPVMRVANQYRWQILLKLPQNYDIKSLKLQELRSLCSASVRFIIDVDPLYFG